MDKFDWARAHSVALELARKSFPFLEAEDVAQETMAALLTDRSSTDGPLAIRSVVLRRGVDMARREWGRGLNARKGRTFLELEANMASHIPQPEHVAQVGDQISAALRIGGTKAGRSRKPETAERHARLIQRVYLYGEKPGAVAKDEGISAAELSRIVSAAKKRRHHVTTGQ